MCQENLKELIKESLEEMTLMTHYQFHHLEIGVYLTFRELTRSPSMSKLFHLSGFALKET